jgi:hypothetical protein
VYAREGVLDLMELVNEVALESKVVVGVVVCKIFSELNAEGMFR